MGAGRGDYKTAVRAQFVRLARTGAAARSQTGELGTAAELFDQYAFLADGLVPSLLLRQACEQGRERGIAPHLLLIHAGALDGAVYLQRLEARTRGRDDGAVAGITEIIDVLTLTPLQVDAAIAEARGKGHAPLLLMPQQIDWSEPPETRRWRAEQAANTLLRRRPEMSAGHRHATWQLVMAPVVPGLAMGGLLVAPGPTWLALAAFFAVPFLFIVGLRVLALLAALRAPVVAEVARAPDSELPTYSVIVPLFREAHVVPGLLQSLLRLDYPAAKLDILLVTESVDPETEAALRALSPPPHVRVLVVPDVQPRTKPKALNYALSHARGDFVVIFDAEDDPDPDQLRRAQHMFKNGPADLMCVQARLALYNQRPGWIARQFMLEYAALFDAMLSALVRLRLPVLLGGTSNHFPRAVLDALGGWDAYNVTEDADLGVRIARAGGSVAILQSTTYEEAPDSFTVWLPQRTRWMKGFMQTWLVHMRRPGRLLDDLGLVGFIGFNAYLGGIVLSALLHPIMIALIGWNAATGQLLVQPQSLLDTLVLAFGLFNLLGGYLCGMLIAAVAAGRRGLLHLIPHLLLLPVYWLLISFAAYRALLQLATRPYLWEKTPHLKRPDNRHG